MTFRATMLFHPVGPLNWATHTEPPASHDFNPPAPAWPDFQRIRD
jgi:hypothetical protein